MAAVESAARAGTATELTRQLAGAEERLQVLEEAVATARTEWSELLRVRAGAQSAGAATGAPREWRQAENTLMAAAQKLEAGRRDSARRQAAEAQPLYESARLAALRFELMREPRALLAQAEKGRARQFAPRSFVRALDAATAAEKLLQEHGQVDDAVRAAAAEATRQAQHALYLLTRIRDACSGDPSTLEGTVLEWEETLQRAVAPLGQRPSFEAGLGPPLQALGGELERLRRDREALRTQTVQGTDVADSLRRNLSAALDSLQQRDRELAELRRLQLEAEAVRRVETAFSAEEGRVLLQQRDLILRLHGLVFASGSADIPPEDQPLLDKVVEAVTAFPEARLVIEGHTDSTGSEATNQELSQRRAEVVRDYLVQHAGVEPGKVTPIGFGSGRPVASNDTEAGRALNRRIEITIARPE
jgi:outer membrane protein OmpA-like peptidoglycan-associated protein